MAESLERHVKSLENAEKNLLNRTFQQTVVAALGQFALTNSDLEALVNQAGHAGGANPERGIFRGI